MHIPGMLVSELPSLPVRPRRSTRPALTGLALLASADASIANQLLLDPIAAATSHLHYAVQLDEDDRAILRGIQAQQPHTVSEFLQLLAEAVENTC